MSALIDELLAKWNPLPDVVQRQRALQAMHDLLVKLVCGGVTNDEDAFLAAYVIGFRACAESEGN